MNLVKVENSLIAGHFELKKTSLKIHGKPDFDSWMLAGEALKHMEGAIHWWIGDWLNYGEQKYGEMYAQAVDETDYEKQTLKNDKWVAGQIEKSRRQDNLTYSHHAEVAGLEPTQQDELLSWAEETNPVRSTRELRKEVKKYKLRAGDAPELPDGKYRIIYADPPWQYSNVMPEYFTEQADHYILENTEVICDLKDKNGKSVKEIISDNAVLFLWVTSPILEESFEVVRAWGFEYKSSFVWDKIKHNMGHYNSVRHELLLVCIRGSCQPDVNKLFDSVLSIERGKHSEKPEKFREIIDTLYPKGKRIELFARKKVDGWDTFGNEIS